MEFGPMSHPEYVVDLGQYQLSEFDLEKCKAGHLTLTGDGKIFTFGAFKKESGHEPLIGWVHGAVVSFSEVGRRSWVIDGMLGIQQLYLAGKRKSKQKLTKWVILDKHIGFDSKEEAEAYITSFERHLFRYPAHQIKQITFEVEE